MNLHRHSQQIKDFTMSNLQSLQQPTSSKGSLSQQIKLLGSKENTNPILADQIKKTDNKGKWDCNALWVQNKQSPNQNLQAQNPVKQQKTDKNYMKSNLDDLQEEICRQASKFGIEQKGACNKENQANQDQDYYTFSKNGQATQNDKFKQVKILSTQLQQTGKFDETLDSLRLKNIPNPKQRTAQLKPLLKNVNQGLPELEDVRAVKELMLDIDNREFEQLPQEYVDELFRLTAILMFRVRNRKHDLKYLQN